MAFVIHGIHGIVLLSSDSCDQELRALTNLAIQVVSAAFLQYILYMYCAVLLKKG